MQRFHSPADARVRDRRRLLAAGLGREPRRHYRKLHPQDCGVPGCGTCHPNKSPRRIPTRAERRAALTLAEARAVPGTRAGRDMAT